jgi:hypothetical protein
MPFVDNVLLTPEEAIAADRCPETGISLKGVNITDHIARLWPLGRSEEAQRRIGMLEAYAQKAVK